MKQRKNLDLCYYYQELSLGFQWLIKARRGYKFDAGVAKAAKLVTEDCPNFCPFYFSGKQNIEHWTVLCPAFNEIRSSESDKIKILRVSSLTWSITFLFYLIIRGPKNLDG